MSTTVSPDLRDALVAQLQTVHALKAGALRMFDPMLATVARERDRGRLDEVEDLLTKMLGAFGGHRDKTADHVRRLAERLSALAASPSRAKIAGVSVGAVARARLGTLKPDHGANARDAFVFEHLEIASLHLLEQLADRAGDPDTAQVARELRADDEEMADTINRNWPNVLSLMLASRGLATLRPAGDS